MAANNAMLQGSAVGQIPLQRKGWLGRNWKWFLLASFLVMVCGGLGIFALIVSWMRSSDVALEALARAQANPAVVQRLGARIEEGWLTSGSINAGTGGTGHASLTVPIAGPKGVATIHVTARRIAGVWNYSEMIAGIESTGERIDLLSGLVQSQSTALDPSVANPQTQATQASGPAASPTPPPSLPTPNSLAGASSDVLQSQDTSTSGVVGELIQCRRSGGVLSVKIRFHNTTAAGISFYALGPNTSYDKYYLVAANKKYFILKDTDGTYLAPGANWDCGMPGVCEKLAPGQGTTWWAKFPAPPADVSKADLFTPVTPPFEGATITDN